MKLKYTNDFAKKLARRKFETKMTYKEIYEKTGISVPNLCDLANGRINPSLSRAILLSKTMGIKLDNLKP